ncbi:unnamed protein product [Vicia faba]|uniref:Uncharacterized protein n=1 Tax=Vicia faba TaxID=3906 RepID=A0AAV1BBG4_VICFA|nr:unnamed protein product [Vicia faba]
MQSSLPHSVHPFHLSITKHCITYLDLPASSLSLYNLSNNITHPLPLIHLSSSSPSPFLNNINRSFPTILRSIRHIHTVPPPPSLIRSSTLHHHPPASTSSGNSAQSFTAFKPLDLPSLALLLSEQHRAPFHLTSSTTTATVSTILPSSTLFTLASSSLLRKFRVLIVSEFLDCDNLYWFCLVLSLYSFEIRRLKL